MKKATGMRSDIKLIENDERIEHYEWLTFMLLFVGAMLAVLMLIGG